VIGDKGERIKRIGTETRVELEKLLDAKVFIELWSRCARAGLMTKRGCQLWLPVGWWPPRLPLRVLRCPPWGCFTLGRPGGETDPHVCHCVCCTAPEGAVSLGRPGGETGLDACPCGYLSELPRGHQAHL